MIEHILSPLSRTHCFAVHFASVNNPWHRMHRASNFAILLPLSSHVDMIMSRHCVAVTKNNSPSRTDTHNSFYCHCHCYTLYCVEKNVNENQATYMYYTVDLYVRAAAIISAELARGKRLNVLLHLWLAYGEF